METPKQELLREKSCMSVEESLKIFNYNLRLAAPSSYEVKRKPAYQRQRGEFKLIILERVKFLEHHFSGDSNDWYSVTFK